MSLRIPQGSITKFIARQTLLLRNEVAAMQENISRHMEEKGMSFNAVSVVTN